MVLTRFLHLQIWDEYNEYIQYDNKVDTNWGITSGSIKLDKILMSEQLSYGEINASSLEVQVYGLDLDLSNRKIKLEAIDSYMEEAYLVDHDENYIVTDLGDYVVVDEINPEHQFPLFCGYIESADKDYTSTDRNIKAYDWFYYHRDDDISIWWNQWWSHYDPDVLYVDLTIQHFLGDLLIHMGLTTNDDISSFINANVEIKNAFVYKDSSSSTTALLGSGIKFSDILSILCRFNNVTPIIDEDFTNIRFVTLNDAVTYDITDNLERAECTWEDFQTDKVTGVGIYSTSNKPAQIQGTTDNLYHIVGNIFILNNSAYDIRVTSQRILNDIKDIQYTPSVLKCIISDLTHRLGDKVHTDKGDSYILNMSLSGTLLIDEEINCPAKNGRVLDDKVEDFNDVLVEGAKSAVFEKDIDHFRTDISNKYEGLSTQVAQNTYNITLEAWRAQNQEELGGVVNAVHVFMYPIIGPDGQIEYPGSIVLETDILLKRNLVDKVKFGVWVKNIPSQYTNYEKYIQFNIQQHEDDPFMVATEPIYYNGTTPLTNQFSGGVILHIMYMENQQFTIGSNTVTLHGFWVGADDSMAKISVTADEILQYVGNNYIDTTTYQSEIQNLQNQIDGHIDYWDGGYVPTLQNAPANTWTTESEKNRHLGDLFRYNYQQSGEDVIDYYRFDKDTTVTPNVFSWVKLGKDDIDEAIRKADEANAKAKAAQEQLDDFLAQGGEYSTLKQTVNTINGTVEGVIAREPTQIQFKTEYQTLSYGKVFTVTEAFTPVNGKIYTTAITNAGWQIDTGTTLDGAKYIKVNDNTLTLQTNTFPIFYHGNTALTGQIAQGDTLSVKYYDNYSLAPSGSKKCFVVQTSDHIYERAHSELAIEKGRMVLRAESGNKMVIQRLDATGEASEFFVSADNIRMSAEEAMSFLAGGTLTLAGQKGVVIDSPNFKVRRDGNVEVTGAIVATSLELRDVTIDADNIDGLSSVATSGDYDDLDGLPDLDLIDNDGNISGGTYGQDSTGIRISKAGLLQASNAIIYGTIYASAGEIGGWHITNDGLNYGMTSFKDTAHDGVWVGQGGIALGKGSFKVDDEGNLNATKANITGAITATSLTLAPNAQTNLASVATSGDYDDLDGTPNLAPVATSGDYDDLNDTPDLTIYLTKTGTITRGTFQEGATGINISSQGLLQASNAVIYGTIYASAGKFAGEIQANSGKIAGFTITSTSLQKSSSTTGFSLSESMLYFSSGSNEAHTLSVGPLGLSTKGYVQAESITKKSSSSKWGGINNNLDTALQTLKTLVQVTTVTESYRLDTSERTYSATKTFTVPTGYSAQMVVCSKTGNNQVRIYSCYLTGTGGNTINYSIRYDGNSSVSNSLEFKVLLIRT